MAIFAFVGLTAAVFLIATPTPAATARCAQVSLALPASTELLSTEFAPSSAAFKATAANFAKAYARACTDGLLTKYKLPSSLLLHNAPEANVAMIYPRDGRTILEYHFITADGRTHVPDADGLHEAIYCAVRAATRAGQEEIDRCLPD